jgi:hypothetical protein
MAMISWRLGAEQTCFSVVVSTRSTAGGSNDELTGAAALTGLSLWRACRRSVGRHGVDLRRLEMILVYSAHTDDPSLEQDCGWLIRRLSIDQIDFRRSDNANQDGARVERGPQGLCRQRGSLCGHRSSHETSVLCLRAWDPPLPTSSTSHTWAEVVLGTLTRRPSISTISVVYSIYLPDTSHKTSRMTATATIAKQIRGSRRTIRSTTLISPSLPNGTTPGHNRG